MKATTDAAAPDLSVRSSRSSVARVDALGIAFVRARRTLQLVTGLGLALLGLHIGRGRIALMVAGARATGRIVAFETRLMPRGGTSTGRTVAFMPVVEFATGTQVVRFTDWLGSSAAARLDSVPVLYRRAAPSVAMIDRPVGNWLPWGPTLALGLFLALDALRAVRARRRSPRRAVT